MKIGIISAFLWVLACSLSCASTGTADEPRALVGQTMKFSAVKLDGTAYQSSSTMGKVVLIDFWASWCTPCRQSMPYYKALYETHRESGFEVVGISVDDELATAKRFAKEYNVPFTMLWDSKKRVVSSANINTMPTALLIDRAGAIVYIHEGFSEQGKAKLESAVLSTLQRE